jgi:hypothetical protein
MAFILFCLIIRNAYQGVLFEMVATDMRKESPNTMEELLKQNYTIYLLGFFVCDFKNYYSLKIKSLLKQDDVYKKTRIYGMYNLFNSTVDDQYR